MRFRGVRSSRNIEDRRRGGARGGRARLGGIGLLVVLAIGYFAGVDITPLLQQGSIPAQGNDAPLNANERAAGEFASHVLATTETVWQDVFSSQLGRDYTPPVLVLFSGQTASACGGASGATGPFYCPSDNKAYLDTDFFATMAQRLGARGDFASAYVIAHEVSHHVQYLLGILGEVHQLRAQVSEAEANALTVRLELQADCFSGVWASHVQGLLDPGDIEEALNAARMIGDDRLQRQAGRIPQPHTFTHGTSEQRARWFGIGYESGDMGQCDTFNADNL